MDISRDDLPLLASLSILLEERNVTRAAKRLGISQPALSTQLARLRDLFGDPLLVQSGRTMVPTERAFALQAPLSKKLSELDQLVRQRIAFDPASSIKTFRIAAPDYVQVVLFTPLIKSLENSAPHIRIAMLTAEPARAWPDMEADHIDFLATSRQLTPENAVAMTLLDETFVLAQRKRHPLGTDPPSLEGFCAAHHILVSTTGGSFSGPVDNQLKKLGRSRHVAVSVPSFLIAPQILMQSDYVAVIPESLANLYRKELDTFPLPFAMPGFSIALSWHAKRENEPAHVWLRKQASFLKFAR